MKYPEGLVAKIEPFSIHDGPGIRTAVFMKGCPLNCLWCPTPQMQKRGPEILFDGDRCRKCGDCIPVCPRKVIEEDAQRGIRIDRKICDGCGLCAESCPQEALDITGKYYSLTDLMAEVEKDVPVYNRSGGGVTVSGGEPILQSGFVGAFLRQCKRQQIHTVLATRGFAPWSSLSTILESVDLVYFDLKHLEKVRHRKLTGVVNQRILENIRKTAEQTSIILRMSLVAGLNDSEADTAALVHLAKSLGKKMIRIELAPYHREGEDLYRKLEREHYLNRLGPPDEETLARIKDTIESSGLNVEIVG
ncbi:MAG: glycyl-radical enzyme activating protein [Deltaproteobacteria bacterium]|nr:glycyl-radical enzyme activating protein [Deltaproteobacteria bacterium]